MTPPWLTSSRRPALRTRRRAEQTGVTAVGVGPECGVLRHPLHSLRSWRLTLCPRGIRRGKASSSDLSWGGGDGSVRLERFWLVEVVRERGDLIDQPSEINL